MNRTWPSNWEIKYSPPLSDDVYLEEEKELRKEIEKKNIITLIKEKILNLITNKRRWKQ